jgi:hypothetical protein
MANALQDLNARLANGVQLTSDAARAYLLK